jgi:uncharacterized membrane protein
MRKVQLPSPPFIFILTAGLLLRLVNLGREFSGDESRIFKVKDTLPEIIRHVVTRDVFPPLTYILLHSWTGISGSWVWLRMYFVLFGILCCIMVYVITRETSGESQANIAFFLAAVSPLLIWSSAYARSYADSAFFILLSAFFMLKLCKRQDYVINWLGYVFSSLLALYTFYYSALFVIMFSVYSLKQMRDKRALRNWVIAHALIAFSFLAWAPVALYQLRHNPVNISAYLEYSGARFMGIHVGILLRNIASVFGADPYFLSQSALSEILPAWLIAAIIMLSGLVIGYLIYWLIKNLPLLKAYSSGAIIFPALAFIPLTIATFSGEFTNMFARSRYQVAAHCFLLIWAGPVLCMLWRERRKLFFTLVAIAATFYCARIIGGVYAPEVAYGQAYSFAASKAIKGDCLVSYNFTRDAGCEGVNLIRLKDIVGVDNKTGKVLPLSGKTKDILRERSASCKKVILINHAYDEFSGANRVLEDYFSSSDFEAVETKRFEGMRVIIFTHNKRANK